VGRKELPPANVLKQVLDSIGDRDNGVNRWALRLKLNKENAQNTFELGKAYTEALVKGRGLLGGLGLDQDPSRARIAQQNQLLADYLLARAESLGHPANEVRAQQVRLAPSFRYQFPVTSHVPLLAEHLPGAVGYFASSAERSRLSELLDQPRVRARMEALGYWFKMADVTDKDVVGPDNPLDKIKDEAGVAEGSSSGRTCSLRTQSSWPRARPAGWARAWVWEWAPKWAACPA